MYTLYVMHTVVNTLNSLRCENRRKDLIFVLKLMWKLVQIQVDLLLRIRFDQMFMLTDTIYLQYPSNKNHKQQSMLSHLAFPDIKSYNCYLFICGSCELLSHYGIWMRSALSVVKMNFVRFYFSFLIFFLIWLQYRMFYNTIYVKW